MVFIYVSVGNRVSDGNCHRCRRPEGRDGLGLWGSCRRRFAGQEKSISVSDTRVPNANPLTYARLTFSTMSQAVRYDWLLYGGKFGNTACRSVPIGVDQEDCHERPLLGQNGQSL